MVPGLHTTLHCNYAILLSDRDISRYAVEVGKLYRPDEARDVRRSQYYSISAAQPGCALDPVLTLSVGSGSRLILGEAVS